MGLDAERLARKYFPGLDEPTFTRLCCAYEAARAENAELRQMGRALLAALAETGPHPMPVEVAANTFRLLGLGRT